jgi:ERCC4-type nuclease
MREIQIHIDSREKKLMSFDIKKATYSNLLIGDIQIIKRFGPKNDETENLVVIERKTVDDLKSSLCDGRFSEQKARILASNFKKKCYIIEKGNHVVEDFENTLKQIIIRLQLKYNISVFLSDSIEDTVFYIHKIQEKLEKDDSFFDTCNNPYEDTVKLCKKENLTVSTCFILQIAQIPSISTKMARVIASHYRNWVELNNGLEDKITFIENTKEVKLGPKRFENLYRYVKVASP